MQKAHSKDVDNIVRLVESVYRGESSRAGWTTEADLLGGQRVDIAMITDILQDPESALLLYINNDQICACVHLQRQRENVHLGMLSVSTALQGQSFGKQIIKYCEAFAHDNWQSKHIVIEVLDGRLELISWYERQGFKKTGKTLPFPNDIRFGVPKKENLFFYEMIKSI